MPMPMPSSFQTHNFKRFKPTDLCIVKPILSSKTHLSQAVSSLDLLHPKGIRLPSHVLVNLLRRCSETKSYKEGMMKQARSMFYQMPQKDYVSWNSMVVGYAHCGRFGEALRQIHGQVLVVGFLSNVVVSSSIVDAYAKCGRMEDARRLFDDMPVRDIPAWTTLVSGYALCGDMESAAELFSQMPKKNTYSWTSLIGGYARNGLGHKALGVFRKMIKHQVKPDEFTFSSCLFACATIASLKYGKQIHAFLVRNNIRTNPVVVSAIVDMYAKCGSMETAMQVFVIVRNMQHVVLWNTMISALAHYGYGKEAVMMLNEILKSGVKPNRTTFVAILNACSHSGLVHEGLQFFNSMHAVHSIVPDLEHYASLIDLLDQAGCIDESMKDTVNHVWYSLLGVCRLNGSTGLEREVTEFLIKWQPQSSAAYVLLSGTYAALVKWGLVEEVRHIMDERRVRKNQSISWIEIENEVHSFTLSDGLHPMKETIYSALGHLNNQIEDNAPYLTEG
ncbi:pentatricopeptide repeat-containing protein at2g21090-like protein [Trifolium pratense]|uniref:Pentatricopeptide repeat-containing protein at2g21090-like protein n=1 Tax=Trifolium pratense TaxID=57577 RepID=A0A2K3P8H9_TRIPR|nr:pentatricopeptide repeat-containing protein at2g21090-like protein [Trifolium pratense]